MKKQFLEEMRKVYKDQQVSSERLRGMVRVFGLGFYRGLLVLSTKKTADKWAKDHAYIIEPDWEPDKSWEWWH